MQLDWLDIFTTFLGILYILLEYRASIWLWVVGVIMPALDIILYWRHGLYADSGMAVYYTLAAIYGFVSWKWMSRKNKSRAEADTPASEETDKGIRHFEKKYILPALLFFLVAWFVIYEVLIHFTNSTIPITDSFANALSFVGLWALAKKYLEQWFIWIVVDAMLSALYLYKGIPFKAALYGLYVVIAVMGYFKWKASMKH